MVNSLREQAWGFICAIFPERQVYIRSDGRVQFFAFNLLMQAILLGVALLLLGWVGFTSVNTIFKDRIIIAKEQSYRQMQEAYETRIANLQLSYDQLNGEVVATEDRFIALVDDLEARHRTLAELIRSKENLREELGLEAAPLEIQFGAATPDYPRPTSENKPKSNLTGPVSTPVPSSAIEAALPAPTMPASVIENAEPFQLGIQIRTPRFLEDTVRRLEKFLRGLPYERPTDHPSLRQIEELEARLDRLLPVQHILIAELQNEIKRDVGHFDQAIKLAGLRPETLLDQADGYTVGVGGPELATLRNNLSVIDPPFNEMVIEATTSFQEFSELATVLAAMPMVPPVHSEKHWQSSGFGTRPDPFTKQLAFHNGIDFSGPRDTNVQMTAPGRVIFAGPNGAYGNSVEVEHGYGLRTRYGHLSKILVSVGNELNKGAIVGTLGSTGRTTGPHLHYEVWFNDTIRNPSKFLRAGRYVHEKQGS